ncbi:MAG TPA: TrmH family RNA methyltransferase [Conexibacter sp.]|nr:TrmH family RNA methyltransferase [Conexibacter sp.]
MSALTGRFQRARADERLAVLEGFHALKHALRFGAEVELVAAVDPEALERMAAELAPDLAGRFRALAGEPVPLELLRTLAPHVPRTQVLALARRPPFDADALAAAPPAGAARPVVLLEDPRDRGNVGAVVRVAAAAEAAGVVTTGMHDPWDPSALRGSAGLHFALPVGRDDGFVAALAHGRAGGPAGGAASNRPLVALDPDGDVLDPAALPPHAVLAFGTERHGLSDALLARADARLRLPMRPGVSSINLATAVAAVLYAWRLSDGAASASARSA